MQGIKAKERGKLSLAAKELQYVIDNEKAGEVKIPAYRLLIDVDRALGRTGAALLQLRNLETISKTAGTDAPQETTFYLLGRERPNGPGCSWRRYQPRVGDGAI